MSTIVTNWKYDQSKTPFQSTREWLARSRPQRVDMMQQLCASEHFLLDGDSLFVEALLNQHCDWRLSQPLHIVYLAEEMVARYRRLGAQFTIVFFQHNSWWWINRPQLEFARTLLLQRLIALADSNASSKFSVAVFQDYLSRKFAPFCMHVRPEFALVTDGCQFEQLLDVSVAKHAQAAVRSFAMMLLASRLHVAFTSRQGLLNNTVYVFAIRVTTELQQEQESVFRLVQDAADGARKVFDKQLAATLAVPVPAQDTAQTVLRHAQTAQLTARDAVTHLALLSLLKQEGAKPALSGGDINIATMAKIHLLSNAVQSLLPVEKRALNGGRSELAEAYLNRFSVYATPVAFGLPSIVPATALADEYADSFDGHLFARIAQLVLNGEGETPSFKPEVFNALFGEAVVAAVVETWKLICETCGSSSSDACFFPFTLSFAKGAPPTKIKNVFEKEPAAPSRGKAPSALDRSIPLVKQLAALYQQPQQQAGGDGGEALSSAAAAAAASASAPWSDAQHCLGDAGWKDAVPGGGYAVCEKLDEYKEVDKMDQEMIQKFVRDQRESGESMGVKKASLTSVLPGAEGEAHKTSAAGEQIQLQNTLSKQEESTHKLLIRREALRNDARSGRLQPSTIFSFIDDVSSDAVVTEAELAAFHDYVASKNTTEHKFLFEDNISNDGTLALSKVKDMDIRVKLTAFTMLQRHLALHAQQYWLLQLWSQWDNELREANDAARSPRMSELVNFFLELQSFLTRLHSSRVQLDKEVASTVCAMCSMLNLGEQYTELMVAEIAKCYVSASSSSSAAGSSAAAAAGDDKKAAKDAAKKDKKDAAAAAKKTGGDAASSAAETGAAAAAAAAAKSPATVAPTVFRPESVVLPHATELDLILKKFTTWCPARFQLCVMGELLERPRGVPDKRMPIPLDPWQKKLLDAVEEGYSAVVTAPTSSGKTFIALYAMTKALRESDTDVVVYVCPNRSLVNQALGDTYARFGHKEYGRKGCAVVGVLGGGSAEDGYVILPFNCQVLVTVPEVLEVILMSPAHQEWAQRIKFVVFDEIHSIETSSVGAVWERLLMSVRCPFVALSATLGNTDELVAWLNRARAKIPDAKPCVLVPGKDDPKIDRFNDIEKHIVLAEPVQVNTVGKTPAGYEDFRRIHPLSCVGFEMLRSKGVEDLRLVPSEVVELFDAMHAVLSTNPRFSVFSRSQCGLRVLESLSTLEPGRYFAGKRYITKPDARRYEDIVVRTLCSWADVADRACTTLVASDGVTQIPLGESDHQHFLDMVQLVLGHFGSGIREQENDLIAAAEAGETTEDTKLPFIHPESPDYVKQQLLPLLVSLHERQMTPCIVFTFAEEDCEALVDAMVQQLADAEQVFRDSAAFPEWVRAEKEKFAEAQRETANQNKAAMHTQRKRDGDGNVIIEHVENAVEMKEYVVPNVLPMYSFKPRFSKVKTSDWEQFLRQMRNLGLNDNVVQALERGIAVHHNGISGKARRHIERMFRQLAVPVIICTETLALGIHSPCKTCVIAGDNVRFTTSQFRQMSGRAGRRGADFLGHCIFLGVPLRRIQRLLTSDLDRLKGHVTMDATTLLRMDTLMNFAPDSNRAQVDQIIKQVFSEPLLIEGRSRVEQNSFESYSALWSRAVLNWAAETGFISSNKDSFSVLSALVTRVCGTLREVHAGPGSFLLAHLLASGALHRATAHFQSGDSDECLAAMFQLFSLLFTTHCDFNTPLEIHESILEDRTLFDEQAPGVNTAPVRAKTNPGDPGHECRHSIVLPGFNEILGGALAQPIADYNARVLGIAVDALRGLSHAKAKLPLSESNFAAGGSSSSSSEAAAAKEKKCPALAKIAAMCNADVQVRHPLAAVSGATDKFASVEDMCRSLRDGLYVDSQMLPTLDLSDSGRHDGRPVLMNAAVADYLVNGYQSEHGKPSRRFLHEYNGLPPRDSWYTLQTHFKAVNSIVDFLGKDFGVAPGKLVKVEERSIFSTDDHVMVALLAYQDQLTTLGASIYFQSASVRQFNDAMRAEKRAKNRAKRAEKNKK